MRVLIFIGLKLAELAGLCGAIYILYLIGLRSPFEIQIVNPTSFDFFMFGLCHILAVVFALGFCALAWIAIKANWRKAGELAKGSGKYKNLLKIWTK